MKKKSHAEAQRPTAKGWQAQRGNRIEVKCLSVNSATLREINLLQTGFTLVEISLSLAIIAFALVTMLGLMPSMLNSSRQSIDYSEIALNVQSFFETNYANSSAGTLPAVGSQSSLVTNTTFRGDLIVSYKDGEDSSSINSIAIVDSNGKPLLTTVQVTYKWPPGAKHPQTYTFTTEVAATKDIPFKP